MSVIFDQLRISDDGKKLYINAHVNKAKAFDGVYIKSVTIMTSDKVSETAPWNPTEESIYHEEFEGTETREVNLVLTASDFCKKWEIGDVSKMNFKDSEMSKTLFFVYIRVGRVGVNEEGCCIPCILDEEYTLGVTFDENILYQRIMDYTRELAQECFIPQGFTDFILLWNAFKASIETEHYIPAIKYFNLLFGNGGYAGGGTVGTRRCGCHG